MSEAELLGVAERAQPGLGGLLRWVQRTLAFREGVGGARLPLGHFANVVDLGNGVGLAISTDGVGTKLLIAQALDRYDTIGIDCVAMNVNDVLCVGAEPLALVDYLAVEAAEPRLLEEIGRGLHEGARRAKVTIVGGELAQVPAIVHGQRAGFGFDLAATCVGLVGLERVIDGGRVEPGDVLIGLPSSGIHSNGLTLARRVLLEEGGLGLEERPAGLARSVGEELLLPTEIYVAAVLEVLRAGVDVRAMAHITGDGFLNLGRVAAPVGFRVEVLPEAPAVFRLIQERGGLSDEEMYRTFNLGVGFCLVVSPPEVDRALGVLRRHYPGAWRMGRAIEDAGRRVGIEGLGLTLE